MSRAYRDNYALIDWSKDLGPVERRARAIKRNSNVISDTLPDQLEHHGYDDGRRTDSKSTFRRWTKEAGLVEKGNDRERPRPMDGRAYARDMQSDVARSVEMLKQGYVPQYKYIRGD